MKDKDLDPQIPGNHRSDEDEEIIQLIDEVVADEEEEVIELSDLATGSSQKDETGGASVETDEIHIPDEKLERALERVIQRTFSEKAEQMIAETIDKAVAKEIKKLKIMLLEDFNGEEKAQDL